MAWIRGGLLTALLCVFLVTSTAPAGSQTPALSVSDLDELAREVDRTEALRAASHLQHTYTHYAQFGLWDDLGALFTRDAEMIWGDRTVSGRAAIVQYNRDALGGGKPGLPDGHVNMMTFDRPLANLTVDGRMVKVRWHGFFMLGGGEEARWEGGIFENEYVREDGAWKISRMHYYPQLAGPYDVGWTNVGPTQPLIPSHFTPEETGVPVPPAEGPAPKTTATLAELERRVDVLNAQDAVRNLQNAYGYYIDRKMWDDVTDLFTADGVFEVGGVGIYEGPANIRRALERDGPAGLKRGQFNDHQQISETVMVSADGREAYIRGIDLGTLGEVDTGKAYWSVSVFSNRMIKGDDGKWRIHEMRIFPVFKSDYKLGWGKSRIVDPLPPPQFAPDRPLPPEDAGEEVIPALADNPATGRPVSYPEGIKVVAKQSLLPPRSVSAPAQAGDIAARVAEATRKLALSRAYDGALNLVTAYGAYLDDSQWTELGSIFAEKGAKEVPYVGFYIGPERIARRTNPGRPGPRRGLVLHGLIQPVILVAPDGRSASMRTRLVQVLVSDNPDRALFNSSTYPNNQAVLVDGVWKLWSISIDEHYVDSAGYKLGWAEIAPHDQPVTPRPTGSSQTISPALAANPPDIWNKDLGVREEGFGGGTGERVEWPDILPMWFSYRNPVSGRVPERYWPNCETCIFAPETSMDRHGYMLPPS